MIIAWSIFVAVLAYFSVCTAVMAKRLGYRRWGLALVPFGYANFIQKISCGFKVISIPVKKYCKMLITMFIVSIIMTVICHFGTKVLYRPEDVAAYVWWSNPIISFQMIACLPIAICVMLFYLSTIKSTIRIADFYGLRFKLDILVYLLLIPCGIIYFFVKPERKRDLYSAL